MSSLRQLILYIVCDGYLYLILVKEIPYRWGAGRAAYPQYGGLKEHRHIMYRSRTYIYRCIKPLSLKLIYRMSAETHAFVSVSHTDIMWRRP